MEKKNITAVIYARVSTNGQDYERQLNDLREYASRMGYVVVKVFAEKISGAKKVAEREALTELLSFVEANRIDKVLVYECSRLSRRVADFINIVDRLNDLHISLYIHQNGLETLQADGKVNPIAQLVIGMLAQFNSMERSLIRSRMESGYNNFRANGDVVGRKVGYRKSAEAMRDEYKEEIRLLRKGLSLRNVQRITSISINTLRKIKAIC